MSTSHHGPVVELRPRGRPAWRKVAAAISLVASAALVIFLLRDQVSLEALAAREADLRTWYRHYPLQTLAVAFALYLVATSLAVPTIWPLSVAYGWLFGFLPAVAIVSLASTCGATVAMLLSRYLLRDFIEQRFEGRWRAIDHGVQREGATFLLTLRLIPVLPFTLVNLLMGLTRLPVRTYFWASLVGMLPATCVYVWAGASVPSLADLVRNGPASLLSWQLLAALAALALMPFAMRRFVRYWRS